MRFLLVHGSGHCGWHWHLTVAALEALGHQAVAIDLPGHGENHADPAKVTLADYADVVLAKLTGPTVLVGHSAGGFAITEAAHRAPANITRLIYLCAYVPAAGLGLAEMRRLSPRNMLEGALEVAADGGSFTFRPERARGLFYQDVPETLATEAIRRLSPQPMKPQITPVTGQPPATLPRSYILCTDDRTIDPDHQAMMSAGFPPGDIHRLAASHSPFLSMPADLAALLVRLAG